jgi:hypothetical protein
MEGTGANILATAEVPSGPYGERSFIQIEILHAALGYDVLDGTAIDKGILNTGIGGQSDLLARISQTRRCIGALDRR